MTGTPQGLKALYTYVESETDLFRERGSHSSSRKRPRPSITGIARSIRAKPSRPPSVRRRSHLHARMGKPNQTEPITGATKEEMDTILNARALLREKQYNFTAYE